MIKEPSKSKPFNYGALYGPVFILLLAVFIFSFNIEEKNAIRVIYDPAPIQVYTKEGNNGILPYLRDKPTKKIIIHSIKPDQEGENYLDVSWLKTLGVNTIDNISVTVKTNSKIIPRIAFRKKYTLEKVYYIVDRDESKDLSLTFEITASFN